MKGKRKTREEVHAKLMATDENYRRLAERLGYEHDDERGYEERTRLILERIEHHRQRAAEARRSEPS